MIQPGTDSSGYCNMHFKGIVPSGVSIGKYISVKQNISRFAQHIDLESMRKLSGDFGVVTPSKENLKLMYDSWDKKKPCSYGDCQFYKHALNFFRCMYVIPLTIMRSSVVSSSEEIVSYIDPSTSSGFPLSIMGYKSKGDAMKSQVFWDIMQAKPHKNFLPIYSTSGKIEIAPVADIERGKIRIFTIPPLPLLWYQLKFGKKISNAMIGYKWSSYGFNPYNRGVHNLALRLQSKPYRFFYDLSGWDKFLPVVKDVYSVLINSLKPVLTSEEFDEFVWTAHNTHSILFKTVYGEVYSKDYGNPSGSGTTTRDNIFAHVIILSHALITAYHRKFGKIPSQALIDSQMIHLFGDDSICAVDEDFSLVCSEEFLTKHFDMYGMTLKFFHGGKDFPLSEMEFLGFKFVLRDDTYLPLYNVGRLAYGYCALVEGVDSREYFACRILVLTLMSYPSNAYPTFQHSTRMFMDWLALQPKLTNTEKMMIQMSQNSDLPKYYFYGFESVSSGPFSFLGTTEVEVLKKHVVKQCQSIRGICIDGCGDPVKAES